ncbi:sodium:solute symporter family transporter [Geobacillus thermoleovorans]|uniref:sodium:solute symporter family transporter n=1 Tax=Geobacillus thermoleovorans TaxID=33941 RepID=UPI003DA20E9D
MAVGIVIGIVCAWLFLADRFRQEAERYGALTLPGYLAKRFGAHGQTILLPPWLAGVLLSGILAAIVTTADSQLLVITSAISEDIVRRSLRLRLSEKRLVALSRAVVVIAGLLGLVLAMTSESLVYFIVSWAWAGIGCTLSPAILLSFFWKRYSGIGAIATIVAGFVSTVIWISSPLEAIVSSRFATFAIVLAAGVLFSLLFPDRQRTR